MHDLAGAFAQYDDLCLWNQLFFRTWEGSEDAYGLASYGLVWGAATFGKRSQGGQWVNGSFGRLQLRKLVKRLPQNCSCSTDALYRFKSDHGMDESPMTLLKSSCYACACRGLPGCSLH
jgi:hypothetical protein